MNFYKLSKLMEQNPITPMAPVAPVAPMAPTGAASSTMLNKPKSAADIVRERNDKIKKDINDKKTGTDLKKTFDNLKGLLKQVGVNVN